MKGRPPNQEKICLLKYMQQNQRENVIIYQYEWEIFKDNMSFCDAGKLL